MTVAELIEKLKEFNPNSIVAVFDDGMMDDASTIEVYDHQPYPEYAERVVIY